MTDLWTEASRDQDAERRELAVEAASLALAPKLAFVLGASSKDEFDDRMALSAAHIERVVEAATINDPGLFPIVHEAIVGEWEQNFDVLATQRASDTQKRNSRRAWERRRVRAAKGMSCPSCGNDLAEDEFSEVWIFDQPDGSQVMEAHCFECGWDGTKTKPAKAASRRSARKAPQRTAAYYWGDDSSSSERYIQFGCYGRSTAKRIFTIMMESGLTGIGIEATGTERQETYDEGMTDDETFIVFGTVPAGHGPFENVYYNVEAKITDSLGMATAARKQAGGKWETDKPGTRGAPNGSSVPHWVPSKPDADAPDEDWIAYLNGEYDPPPTSTRTGSADSTCRNCDKPTDGAPYCSDTCEDTDKLPAPRDDMETATKSASHEAPKIVSAQDGQHLAATVVTHAGKYHWAVTSIDGEREYATGSTDSQQQGVRISGALLKRLEAKYVWVDDDDEEEKESEPPAEKPDAEAPPAVEAEPTEAPVEEKPAEPAPPVPADPAQSGEAVSKDEVPVPPQSEAVPSAPVGNDQQAQPATDAAAPPGAAPAQDGMADGTDAVVDPTSMQVGQSTSMAYTMASGGSGSVEVTFVREDNEVFYFNGPTGEFGVALREGKWIDAAATSFTFGAAAGASSEGQGQVGGPTAGEQAEGSPVAPPAAATPAEAPPAEAPAEKPAEAPAAPAEKAAPADGEKKDEPPKDDDEKDGDGKKKGSPPWAKK